MRVFRWILQGLFAAALPCAGAGEASGNALAELQQALAATKPVVDVRARYEAVDQQPFAQDAEALTLRARLGFETGKAWGTSLLVEGEAVVPLVDDYNSTTNGRVEYPVVADPESYEINRLQLANTSLPGTTITLGRQRLIQDDHRFVGNVGWRQNEQTFDALRVVNLGIPKVVIDLSYVNQVNRIYGRDGLPGPNVGRFTGDTWLANLSWQSPAGKLTAFGYLIDIEQLPQPVQDSSQTFGLRFTGERPVSGVKLGWIASWALQQPCGANPLDFRNDYYLAELNAGWRMWKGGAGFEVLEGNGAKGFTTPLATLHRFQGWADKFLTTPANGIRDFYLTAGYQKKGLGPLDGLTISAAWHRFDSQRAQQDFGDELDLQVQGTWRRYTGTLKYAAYNAAASTPSTIRDTDKLWAQVEYAW
jgi:hypothetical protein